MSKKLTVGLTGGIGSGKTTVCQLFEQLGITIIDADIIARQIVQPEKPAFHRICSHFSAEILTPKGEVDRRRLQQIIFNDSEEKQWLENLLHPIIIQELNQQIKLATSAYVIAVIPLLIEANCTSMVDRILVVDAPNSQCLDRASQRDHLSHEQVEKIIKTQLDRQTRLAVADDIIDNSTDLQNLQKQVRQLHQRYLKGS